MKTNNFKNQKGFMSMFMIFIFFSMLVIIIILAVSVKTTNNANDYLKNRIDNKNIKLEDCQPIKIAENRSI